MKSWDQSSIRRALVDAEIFGGSFSAQGVSIDSRTLKKGQLFLCIKGDSFDGHDFTLGAIASGAAAVVGSKNYFLSRRKEIEDSGGIYVSVNDPFVSLQQMAEYSRSQMGAIVLGVAGSNGKTSTKDMLYTMAQSLSSNVYCTPGNLNNQIGLPLTLVNIPIDARLLILELGMNHPGELTALSNLGRPDYSVVTSIAEEHAEFFPNLESIARAEMEIADGMKPGASLVFSAMSPCQDVARSICQEKGIKLVVSGGAPVKLSRDGIQFEWKNKIINNPNYLHTVMGENLQCAMDLLSLAGFKDEEISRVAALAGPLTPRRFQIFRRGNTILIDDSYNANEASFTAAIRSMRALLPDGRLALFAGEMAELGHKSADAHRAVGRAAAEAGIQSLNLAGSADAGLILQAFNESQEKTPASSRGLARLEGRPLELLHEFDATAFDGILVKGSRRARMDQISDALKATGFT